MDKLKKIANILTYLCLFLLPWQTRYIWRAGVLNNGPYEYATIALYGTDILILAALLLNLILIFHKSGGFKDKKYWLLILLLLMSGCISLLMSIDKQLTLYALARLAIGACLFWLISYRLSLKNLLLTFILAALLQSGLGLWQFYNQNTPANKWLGLAAHNPKELGTAVVELTAPDGGQERWLRAYGAFDHPNILAGFLALALVLSWWRLLSSPSGKRFSGPELFYALSLIILSGGLFVTFSRAGILAAAGGIFVLLLFGPNWRKKILALLVTVAAGLTLWPGYGYLYQGRFQALDGTDAGARLEIQSLTDRQVYFQHAQNLIRRHPLLGSGLGNFGLAVHQNIASHLQSYYYQPVHNVWLLTICEVGFGGAIIFALFWLWLGLDAIISFAQKNTQAVLSLSLLVCLLPLSLLDHWLWSLHAGVLILWLSLGLALKGTKIESTLS